MSLRDDDKTFTLTCRRLHESDKAIKVIDLESGEELWLPFSQIEETEFDANGNGFIVMSEWIARKKGLA